MAIAYPLALPSRKPREIMWSRRAAVGMGVSPFTFSQQTYEHQGQMWMPKVDLPPMSRAQAEDWIAFFLALNGVQGYFLMGDPVNIAPRGSWGSNPLVNGAHATALKILSVKNLAAGATIKAGDWLQVTAGGAARLHKVAQDATANGSGIASVDIWPRLRGTLADGDAITTSSPKGTFRLAGNDQSWTQSLAAITQGISFDCMEYLTV